MAHHLPGGAGEVLLAAHAGDVAAGDVFSGEALEERGARGAGDEHEDVVGGGVHVGSAPGFDSEAVASGSEDEVVAGGHVRLVKREGLVGVVDFEDPVGAGADVEHEDVVHAEKEVPEARVAAAVLQCEGVVYGYVAAV